MFIHTSNEIKEESVPRKSQQQTTFKASTHDPEYDTPHAYSLRQHLYLISSENIISKSKEFPYDFEYGWRRKPPFAGINLSGANLSKANLSGADLRQANLSGVDLTEADLSGADLYEVNMSTVTLSGTNLTGADMSGAYTIYDREGHPSEVRPFR